MSNTFYFTGGAAPVRSDLNATIEAKTITISAKYEDGIFKPLEDVKIEEGTLVEVHIPSYAGRLRTKSRSVQEFAFYGMWRDRTDIGDRVEYVNSLRG